MLSLTDIPTPVYLVALDIMGVDRPAAPSVAPILLHSAEQRADYHQPRLGDGTPLTAFGAALAMYVSLSGPLAEDGGEFAGWSGYLVAA